MKKRILVTDFLCVEAHRALNIDVIECLSLNFDIAVISVDGYFEEKKEEWINKGITIIDYSTKNQKNGKIKSKIYSVEIMKITWKESCQHKYDAIVSLAFDTIACALGIKYIQKTPLFIYQHKNIDELTNTLKRQLFNLYKNRVYHIVFEDFFKKHLLDVQGVMENRCVVIPHPIKDIIEYDTDIKYDCVGLCNSNSEEFIEDILHETSCDEEESLKIILRSKKYLKSNKQVSIIQGFLSLDDYYGYVNASDCVLVPVPETYIYRLSGSIYDALSRKKRVLTTSRFYAEEYDKIYPGICNHVSDASSTIEYLKNKDDIDKIALKSFEKFIKDHSKKNVAQVMYSEISKVLEELK